MFSIIVRGLAIPRHHGGVARCCELLVASLVVLHSGQVGRLGEGHHPNDDSSSSTSDRESSG